MKTKKRFISWGHKIHTHTHSYIHVAFGKAFEYLGYEVYYFDDDDDVSNFDFSDCLFLTEGQVDKNIPIRKDSRYILHNCDAEKYQDTSYLLLQVYTGGAPGTNGKINDLSGIENRGESLDKCIFYDNSGPVLYQPWATDLLPHEIEKDLIVVNNKTALFVGSINAGSGGNENQVRPFAAACNRNGYEFTGHVTQFGQSGVKNNQSFEQNRKAIADSEIAPALVGTWQKEHDYIPCRIFKNISYGKLGLTNSSISNYILDGTVIYNDSEEQLFYDYLSMDVEKQKRLFKSSSKLIAEKHTYLNRIDTILERF
jgi:hypothetical protein